jgi:hypothetical protein
MRSILLSLFVFAGCGAPTGSGDLAAPIADPGFDRVLGIGETTTLSALLSCDPSGGGLNYHWTLINKPEGSNVAPDKDALKAVQFGVTVDITGTYLFGLTVSNGSRTSAAEVVVVEATAAQNRWTSSSASPILEDRCGKAL